jgi:O-antigen/teichoic acid export membrane protein
MGHSTVIVKNTVFLYMRTLFIMLISIYTSRVLLDKLGVENFGIYNIVGGVVATFASLRGVFAQSVQRFLNFEKGQGNEEKVTDVFNISLLIHVVLGVVFAVLVGGFGYYYIPRYLLLPNGMLDIAMFVFYCSVITSVIAIVTIPYDSVIIANEKFDFYAIVSILMLLLD